MAWVILVLAIVLGAAGCRRKEQTAEQAVAYIPEEVGSADVSFYSCGGEKDFTVQGAELETLRRWTAELRLERRTFETGETPSDRDGGEVYCVDLGDSYMGFSYYMGGEDENYILLGKEWYKTVNGGNPFKGMGQEETSGEPGAESITADRIPMIMAEGELYLDMGRPMPVEIAPSAVIGTVTSNVRPSDIPAVNGQSNFDCIGAQYARYEDGIAVKLDHEWWYFQKEEMLGIKLEAPDASPAGLTLVCIQSGGRPTGKLFTGSYYWLEKETDGRWAEVEMKLPEETVGWTDEAWNIEMDGRTVWEVDWEWLYGQLEPGNYRIGKKINDFRGAGDYDKYDYYGGFSVEGI